MYIFSSRLVAFQTVWGLLGQPIRTFFASFGCLSDGLGLVGATHSYIFASIGCLSGNVKRKRKHPGQQKEYPKKPQQVLTH